MTWWKPRSKLEAVSRATARVPDVSVGEPGWREWLHQSVTDRTRRENAIQAAKLGATAPQDCPLRCARRAARPKAGGRDLD